MNPPMWTLETNRTQGEFERVRLCPYGLFRGEAQLAQESASHRSDPSSPRTPFKDFSSQTINSILNRLKDDLLHSKNLKLLSSISTPKFSQLRLGHLNTLLVHVMGCSIHSQRCCCITMSCRSISFPQIRHFGRDISIPLFSHRLSSPMGFSRGEDQTPPLGFLPLSHTRSLSFRLPLP
jgi:hypothetical protein